MNVLDTVILGLVEGITEFLPISSTGHLILTSHLLGLKGEVIETFEVFIQLGAILAVVFLYAGRFRRLFDFSNPGGFAGVRGWMLVGLTSLPILVLGYKLQHYIKAHWFNPTTVAWALGLGGILLILAEMRKHDHDEAALDNITPRQALQIGVFQSLALCPGVSRAGATIIGGLFSGLSRQAAAEYSFIVAVPIMVLVSLKDLKDILPKLQPNDLSMFALGFVVAFASAFFAVKYFVRLLERHTLSIFGVYRIALALLVFWMLV